MIGKRFTTDHGSCYPMHFLGFFEDFFCEVYECVWGLEIVFALFGGGGWFFMGW